MKNTNHFFRFNFDEEINESNANKIVSNIEQLGNEFFNLLLIFNQKKFGWDIFETPLNSITLI